MNIIFLDFDGPMVNARSKFLPGNFGQRATRFDPVAVALVNRLIITADARLVISSTWRMQGYTAMCDLLAANRMNPDRLHDDWRTTDPLQDRGRCRTAEIQIWLDRHPETASYVAIDDDLVDLPGSVRVCDRNGIQIDDFLIAAKLLGVSAGKLMYEKTAVT